MNTNSETTTPAKHTPSPGPALAQWAGRFGQFIVVPAVVGVFAVVAVHTAIALGPQKIRTVQVDEYDPYLDDFVVFYSAATMMADRDGADVYELVAIRSAEANTASIPIDQTYTLPFFNPPPVLLVIAPLALFPLGAAAVVWLALNGLAAAAAATTLIRAAPPIVSGSRAALFGLGLISSAPFYQVVIHGQTTPLFAGAFVLIWLGMFRERSDRALTIGLILLGIKPQLLLVPVLAAVIYGRWRALALAAALWAAAYGVSMIVLGPQILTSHVSLLIEASQWEEENGISIYGMFGWNAFVHALDPSASRAEALALQIALSTVTVAAVLSIVWRARTHRISAQSAFAGVSIGTVLISPHLYHHDVLIAAPAIGLLWFGLRGLNSAVFGILLLGFWLLGHYHFDLLASSGVNGVTLAMSILVVAILIESIRGMNPLLQRWNGGTLREA